ncbi:MAG TPA: twin-arginine translocase TatA/TatE family subunit [Flavobacteriia bacterium]|nr:twin-arginine translocase TatA/TatE family subunit [Flavobacteriia bacterium]
MILFIGGSEMFFIAVLVVMIFGADKIPEIARGLGKGLRQIKHATNDIKREITESAKENGLDKDLLGDIKDTATDIKKGVTENLDDIVGPIKRKR